MPSPTTSKTSTSPWLTADGTLNTTPESSETFEAVFTIDKTVYRYAGTASADVKTPFDNIKVQMEYRDTSELVGEPTFRAEVGDTLDFNIYLIPSAGIHGKFAELPGVESSAGVSPMDGFEGTGHWESYESDEEQSDSDSS
ncbi:hypothetical protein BD779DRAFT_1478092 [Infundibulicybe gibba]|nr:hypothetical protein BD779DRAFT_1478092 [Infundibulicybe gibba]